MMEPTQHPTLLGPPTSLAFELVDDLERQTTLATFAGRYLLVYFGFTNCRVVCPRALARLSEVMERLGARSTIVSALYITVDPERDTPAVMRSFLQTHYPRITGLTGSRNAIDAVRTSFRVHANWREDPAGRGEYSVPHSAFSYLVGPDGQFLAHFPDIFDADRILSNLASVLPENSHFLTDETLYPQTKR